MATLTTSTNSLSSPKIHFEVVNFHRDRSWAAKGKELVTMFNVETVFRSSSSSLSVDWAHMMFDVMGIYVSTKEKTEKNV